MGRRLGRLVLVLTRRVLLPTVLLAAVLAGAAPASADEPTPTPTPTRIPTQSLSPPSQQQIDDAKAALERLRNQGKSGATPTTLTKVAGPTADAADSGRGSLLSRVGDEAWWTIGAGLLVLLVASESTRLGVKRAKHRKGA
jgi:hypothetical protein